jgi:hypothetical protein
VSAEWREGKETGIHPILAKQSISNHATMKLQRNSHIKIKRGSGAVVGVA